MLFRAVSGVLRRRSTLPRFALAGSPGRGRGIASALAITAVFGGLAGPVRAQEGGDVDGTNDVDQAGPASSEGLNRLVDALQSGSSFKVRATAAVALGRMQTVDAVSPLSAALRRDDSYAVRAAAAAALGRLGEMSALPGLFDALHDREPLVRTEAREALVRFHKPEYLLAFRDALRADDALVRLAAVRAYGDTLRAPEASVGIASQVVNALGDVDEDVVAAAELAISSLPHDRAVPMLVDGLEHGGSSVRAGCARLLTKRSDPRAVAPLEALIVDTDQPESVRAPARAALRTAAEYVDVTTRLAAAGDATSPERKNALRILAVLGDGRAMGLIEKALKDSDPAIRTAAARAAVDMGDDRAKKALNDAVSRETDPRQKRQLELLLKSLR